MAFNGSGSFVRTDGVRSGADVHAQQKTAGVKVRADLTDTELEDMATGMELAVLRDGQNSPSANLPMNSYKHTGVASASGSSSRTEYASTATVQDGAILDAGDTGGSATAFTATLSPAITAYADKQLFRVKFNAAFGANPTIAFNGLTAKKMYYMVGSTATQLTTDNVPQNYVGLLRYDSSLDSSAGAFLLTNPPLALRPAITAADITGLTAETAPATDDLVVLSDTSESGAANKMTLANLVTVVNALTEDTTPDVSNDFVLTYDASASAAKKVKPTNLAPSAATQAQQETASSTSVYVSPGRQQFHPSAAKAWCLFDGTGTPAVTGTPYNVSSITDNGTGDHTVNWTTSFSSANYCVVTANNGYTGVKAVTTCIRALAAGSVRVMTQQLSSDTVSAVDLTQICVAAFGDQ